MRPRAKGVAAQISRTWTFRSLPFQALLPESYQNSWTSTDGNILQKSKIASGVWGPWPQPPEALEFDESSFAGLGIGASTVQSLIEFLSRFC